MTTLREAAQQALDALNEITGWQSLAPQRVMDEVENAITALKTALEQPEQRREWRGLTKEEREAAIRWAIELENTQFSRNVARAIEAKLKEKNHD